MNRNKKSGFTLVEIMIVVLIIGILLAIAVPNFLRARESSRAKTIAATLEKVDAAKEQCAMDKNLATGDECVDGDMGDYIKTFPPTFPVTGAFVKGNVGTEATFAGDTASDWAAK